MVFSSGELKQGRGFKARWDVIFTLFSVLFLLIVIINGIENTLPYQCIYSILAAFNVLQAIEWVLNWIVNRYSFETEYKIPGTAAPDGSCTFTYRSSSRKKGEFNSPRYPSNYPSDINCTYLFLATPNEQVTLVFDHFKVRSQPSNSTTGFYGLIAILLLLYLLFQ